MSRHFSANASAVVPSARRATSCATPAEPPPKGSVTDGIVKMEALRSHSSLLARLHGLLDEYRHARRRTENHLAFLPGLAIELPGARQEDMPPGVTLITCSLDAFQASLASDHILQMHDAQHRLSCSWEDLRVLAARDRLFPGSLTALMRHCERLEAAAQSSRSYAW